MRVVPAGGIGSARRGSFLTWLLGALVAWAISAVLPRVVFAQIRPIELEGFVVTGTPVPRTEGTEASHVTVLRGEELRVRGMTRVSEALSEVPGLVLVQNGSFGGVTSTYFRGAEGDHVKVLVDGVEVNQPGGAFDFSGLLLSGVERIEVVRGPASALYGSDAMAGVIHIITRRGQGPAGGYLSSSGGTHGRLNLGAGLHGGVGAFGYSLFLAREASDGILAFNNEFRNTVLSGKLSGASLGGNRVEISGRYSDRTYHFPTDGGGNVVDRNAFSFGEEFTLAVEAGRSVSRTLDLTASLRGHRWDGGSDDRPDDPADTLGFYGFLSEDSFQRRMGAIRADLAPSAKTRISIGFELEQEEATSRSESLSQWGSSLGQDRWVRWNQAYYVHAVAESPGWAGNLGARVDDNDQYGTFLTYQAGASYSLSSTGTRFRGSLGRGLKEPTFVEVSSTGYSVGNPALEPERSEAWDVGMVQDLPRFGGTVSMTWFHQGLRDLIQYTPDSTEPGGANFFNVAKVRITGLEVALEIPVGDLALSGGYTYLNSEVLDSGFDEGEGAIFVEGKPLIRRPRHQARLALTESFTWGTLSGDLRWTGSRFDRDFSVWPAEAVVLPSYRLLNLSMDIGLLRSEENRPGLDLMLRGDNLLDEDYQGVFGFDSPGRIFLVGLRMSFGG